jgi:hypothetical protein
VDYPKPVSVVFDGEEVLGIATAEDFVEVDFSIGVSMKLYDRISVDGQLREVAGLSHNFQRRGPQPAEGVTGVQSTRVRHCELGHLGPRPRHAPPLTE